MLTAATYDDANLILRLYELRREPKLREAREWFSANFKGVKTMEDLQRVAPPGSAGDPMSGWLQAIGIWWRPLSRPAF